MRKFSDKSCRGNQDTHFMCITFFPENRAVYEIMWKNIVQPGRPQLTIQYGACPMHAGYPRLEIRTANMQYLLIFHGNKGYSTEPQYYAIRRVYCLPCLIQVL